MQTGLNIQLGDSLETVLTRITEAIAWSAPRVQILQPKSCLRSLELFPHPLEDGRKRVVASVVSKRFHALGRPERKPACDLALGRLLIYEPDCNLAHGLEESETEGFVDHDNTPPWDTWIAYIYEPKRNYLLSWVPGEFISLVESGIQVSPEMSFRWLDNENLALTAMLRDRGCLVPSLG